MAGLAEDRSSPGGTATCNVTGGPTTGMPEQRSPVKGSARNRHEPGLAARSGSTGGSEAGHAAPPRRYGRQATDEDTTRRVPTATHAAAVEECPPPAGGGVLLMTATFHGERQHGRRRASATTTQPRARWSTEANHGGATRRTEDATVADEHGHKSADAVGTGAPTAQRTQAAVVEHVHDTRKKDRRHEVAGLGDRRTKDGGRGALDVGAGGHHDDDPRVCIVETKGGTTPSDTRAALRRGAPR